MSGSIFTVNSHIYEVKMYGLLQRIPGNIVHSDFYYVNIGNIINPPQADKQAVPTYSNRLFSQDLEPAYLLIKGSQPFAHYELLKRESLVDNPFQEWGGLRCPTKC